PDVLLRWMARGRSVLEVEARGLFVVTDVCLEPSAKVRLGDGRWRQLRVQCAQRGRDQRLSIPLVRAAKLQAFPVEDLVVQPDVVNRQELGARRMVAAGLLEGVNGFVVHVAGDDDRGEGCIVRGGTRAAGERGEEDHGPGDAEHSGAAYVPGPRDESAT